MSAVDLAALRRELGPDAFRREPRQLVHGLVHGALASLAVAGISIASPAVAVALSLLLGHSIACLAFLAHEVSHGAVLARGPTRAVVELILWSPSLVSSTMWRRVHNELHHARFNTPGDPDRNFLMGERSLAARLYGALFYPGSGRPPWSPAIADHFVPYVVRNTLAVFSKRARASELVPAAPSYTPRERAAVALELAAISTLQAALFAAVGGEIWRYLLAGPTAWWSASAVVMAYVFTNHFPCPITERPDVFGGTLSLRVPRWLDALHLCFSHHVEHHLFPSMSSRHFPRLRRHLERAAPDSYRCAGPWEAWRALAAPPRAVPLPRPGTAPERLRTL